MSILKCFALALVTMASLSTACCSAADSKPADPKPADPKPAETKKKDPKDMNADEANEAGLCPICKGEFKPVYHYEYKGKEYHFKTRQCCKDFIADPTKYGAKGSEWKSSLPPPVEEKKDPKKPAK